MLPEIRQYRPPRMALQIRDHRAVLAVEERDLLAEARDAAGCLLAACDVRERLYPTEAALYN